MRYANDCYFAAEHEEMERRLKDWTAKGGVVLHGPKDMLAENCFGIFGEECEKTPYRYGKVIIARGERFCRYPDGEEIAPYVDSAGSCVVKYEGEELAGKMGISGRAAGIRERNDYRKPSFHPFCTAAEVSERDLSVSMASGDGRKRRSGRP